MLNKDPASRPSLEDIVRHPLVNPHLRAILGTPTAARATAAAGGITRDSTPRSVAASGAVPAPTGDRSGNEIEASNGQFRRDQWGAEHVVESDTMASADHRRRSMRPSDMLRLPVADDFAAKRPPSRESEHPESVMGPRRMHNGPGLGDGDETARQRRLRPKVSLLRLAGGRGRSARRNTLEAGGDRGRGRGGGLLGGQGGRDDSSSSVTPSVAYISKDARTGYSQDSPSTPASTPAGVGS